ncbi:hypothetical protein G5V59_18065 [Nocardioides sp. W3-2-3]|nr:hypothetical protein [Nocardioides convexus]
MSRDDTITAALRHLDPAPASDLTAAERARADALLARIVATPGGRTPSSRPRVRTLAGAGVAAATLACLPALLLGGGDAFGSWTPTPEPLSVSAAGAAEARCRASLDVPDRTTRVALAERRGEWTYVLLAGPGGEATCLMPDEGDSVFGGSTADPPAPPALALDGLDETGSMTNVTDEGSYSYTEGYIGRDVTGVTVHVSTGLDIQASIADGRFAAWWPSIEQSSRHPEGESWTFTVHLADGTTRESAG